MRPELPVKEGLPPLGHVLEDEARGGAVQGKSARTRPILHVKTETEKKRGQGKIHENEIKIELYVGRGHVQDNSHKNNII